MFNSGPNALAYAALLVWPAVMAVLFRTLGPVRGLLAGLLGGYLLLPPSPAGFELPIMPTLAKESITSLAALTLSLVLFRPFPGLIPQGWAARLLLAAFVFGPVLTVLGNTDPIVWGVFVLPGLSLSEVASITINQVLMVAPLLLARAFIVKESDLRDVLWAVLWGALAYSLPMLLEVRLSPQINIWVYGFFQHSFEQMMRGEGFRPIVFLYHGLWAAFLAATGLFAASALLRDGEGRRTVAMAVAVVWLLALLVLCKSLGSLLYGIVIGPVILFTPARLQVRLAAILALLTLLYPILRGADLVPVERILALAESVDPARAQSLGFRLGNEEVLLDHAEQRQLLGWGTWGRNLTYDVQSGEPLTVSDGRWIIVLGMFGWIGYLAEFGLLALPVFLLWWRALPAASHCVAALSLMLAVNMVDLLPNATLTPITWLFAGALLGVTERASRTAASRVALPAFRTVL